MWRVSMTPTVPVSMSGAGGVCSWRSGWPPLGDVVMMSTHWAHRRRPLQGATWPRMAGQLVLA